jgi:hypothetical protein
MRRSVFYSLLTFVTVAGCRSDQPIEPSAPAADLEEIQGTLQQLGYKGLVGVSTVTQYVNGRAQATARNLLLPPEALGMLRRAMVARPEYAVRLFPDMAALALEPTNPDSLDLANNSTIDRGQIYTPPSIFGRITQDIRLIISSQFLDYNPATSSWYVVPGGHLDSSYIQARTNSAGHFHGSSVEERRLDRRVGRMTRDSPDFTGSLVETWYVPEVAQEVNTTEWVRLVGGPRDGQTTVFFSLRPYLVRVQGLTRIPPNDVIYSRVGGTVIHPEDFNDWATQELVDSLLSGANAYNAATNTVMRVNDASLMFGGKFDIGRRVTLNGRTTIQNCQDGIPTDCWGGVDKAHSEHRLGTEVDINPQGGNTDTLKATFMRILGQRFELVIEGNHLHARVPSSVYHQ